MSDPIPSVARGVYAQPYLIGRRREFVAIDSRGEQVASRLVREGRDPSSALTDLWDELDEADPIAPHASPPSLRLLS